MSSNQQLLDNEMPVHPSAGAPDAETSLAVGAALNEFPYETPLFQQCWWQSLASRFDIPVKMGDLLICRKKLLKGLLSLREARVAGWNNAWHQDLTATRVDALEELAHTSRWDYFRMTWSEARQNRQALDRLTQKGFLWTQKPAPTQYWIDLSEGFEGYLNSLSANGRKGLRKKYKRALPLNPELVTCHTDEAIDAFFEEFFPHHWAYWDEKSSGSYFHHAEEQQFIIQWAKALNQNGQLLLERLVLDGKTVNMSMAIRSGNAVYWLLTLNTGELLDATPGMVALYMRLEQLAAQGVTSFHMGSGDYFYKVQSANRQDTCHEVIVCNPRSLKGRIYYQWAIRQKSAAEQAPTEA
jgi:hypothetical protein